MIQLMSQDARSNEALNLQAANAAAVADAFENVDSKRRCSGPQLSARALCRPPVLASQSTRQPCPCEQRSVPNHCYARFAVACVDPRLVSTWYTHARQP